MNVSPRSRPYLGFGTGFTVSLGFSLISVSSFGSPGILVSVMLPKSFGEFVCYLITKTENKRLGILC